MGFVILYFGAAVATKSPTLLLVAQVFSLLLSMLLIFYCSHPLAHFIAGRAYGVRTQYFFLGKSDFRKIGGSIGRLSGFLPTLGTKFDTTKVAVVGRIPRAILFGSGAIVSSVMMAAPLLIAFIFSFNRAALLLGTLVFLATILTELIFSTRIGDLQKMKRELARS